MVKAVEGATWLVRDQRIRFRGDGMGWDGSVSSTWQARSTADLKCQRPCRRLPPGGLGASGGGWRGGRGGASDFCGAAAPPPIHHCGNLACRSLRSAYLSTILWLDWPISLISGEL